MSLPVSRIVKLKVNCLKNPIGTVGIVVQDYRSGSMVIFENGEYDGFADDEILMFLEDTGRNSICIKDYEFKHVIRLSVDYDKGMFNKAFEEGKR